VHINEPGRTEWEGFDSATAAAAAGGTTTMVDMPLNCIPVTTSQAALATKLEAIKGRLRVDCGFYGGLIPSNLNELPALVAAGVLGFKAFMANSGIPEFPHVTPADLMRIMPHFAKLGVPLLAHAELEGEIALGDRPPSEYSTYLASRPKSWENAAIRILITESARSRVPVHIVHLSSAEALPLIEAARASQVPITVETCPHYLSFCAEEIHAGDTRFKCAPPIREAANREELWLGLARGTIDCVVSDHSPCTPDLKEKGHGSFLEAWGGVSGLEFSLSATWTEAARRGHSLAEVVNWVATRPARLVGLSQTKGRLAPGLDADLVLFDPDHEWQVADALIHHRHKVTPYASRTLKGKVRATYVRGRKVYEDGQFTSEPFGSFLMRGS
jgi:allantoinase